jgi:hypothetical protein
MCLRQFEQDIEAMHQEEQEEVRLSFIIWKLKICKSLLEFNLK